jgi:DNA-binding CsgD family transcriptional regulator/energy-coupling factor transporter ATP-binding protein EcfA2
VAGPVLLERERELSELAQAVRDAAAGGGGLVLVSGEAGIGKSSLVRAVRGLLPAEARLLVGHCDDLGTPRTLGPFRDLVGQVGAELTRALREGGERDAVLAALRAELDWAGHPTVLVVEDVHWADEATLDVLRYLARRVAELPAVLVLTYRDDELTREHPLQPLLGQAAASGRVRRLPLRRLSPDAVRWLSAASQVDAGRVFALTAGNPFFVTEMLAGGDGDRVPSTVVDAVLARVRRLDPATQAALEQLAVVPSTVERWLVDALVPGGLAALAAAEEHGLLTVSPASVAFGHELARRAVADSLPVARRVALNRRVLLALAGREDADLCRIVHHAALAGDGDAIVRHGPAVARDAAAAGAHREAAAHYRLVLRHWERFDPAERADLLERYAVECYTIGTAEAIAVLEPAGDRRLLALALRNQSQLHMLAHRATDCVAVGERAIALARELGDAAILSHALNNVGTARWQLGDQAGWDLIEESLRVALAAGEIEHACRSYVLTVWNLLDDLRLDEAERKLAHGIRLAEGSDHLGYLGYLHVELGYWLTRAGQVVPPPASEHPYALQAAGRWREAAAAWRAAGFPYEHAAALAESPDPRDRLAPLAELDALGAAPLARLVRAGLGELGVARVPRGPVGATRQNPAGLTERQVQVLRLLGQGRTNAEIADRLVVSTQTVDSHVAAVLAKLGVTTRRAAAARARDLGVLDPEVR